MMKQRKFFLIFVIMACVCTTACTEKKLELDGNDFRIETKEVLNCSEEIYTKYYEEGNQTIYLACISEINLIDNNQNISLKRYLSKDMETIDSVLNKITNKLSAVAYAYDGGTVVYQDLQEHKITNHGLTVVQCNTMEGNKDVYIGPWQMNYENVCSQK